MRERTFVASGPDAAVERFATDVHYYLSLQPRQLPSRYLYDALGSALFDAICRLPWYRITRAELNLLAAHGREIFLNAGRVTKVVELGPGSGDKLNAFIRATEHPFDAVDVHLIDVSASALETAIHALRGLAGIHLVAHVQSYENGLREALTSAAGPRKADDRTLVLFLGSNIGNFDRPGAEAFLRNIRAVLEPDDRFLLGADLVKAERELLLAYDDPLGVTAAFNRNLLCRINRELGGDFDLEQFAHRAVWNPEHSRVEMHLVSLARQHVRVPAAEIEFTLERDESIWTESSYKFQSDDVVELLEQNGFSLVSQWVDRDAGFALTLVRAV